MVIHLCNWAWLAISTLSLFGWSYWSLGVSSDCGVWLMASLPKKTWFDVWATTFQHSGSGRVGIAHSTDGLWGTLRKDMQQNDPLIVCVCNRYIFIPLGGSKYFMYNMWPVFTFVALWHDIELKLLAWGWLICLFLLPEIIASSLFTYKKVSRIRMSVALIIDWVSFFF